MSRNERGVMDELTVARLYLKGQTPDLVTLNIPGTHYELHLKPTEEVTPSPQGRVRGQVRLPVWKLDVVTAGGAFIEPVYGKPRRVQGSVTAVLPLTNSVVVDVCGQPIIGDLPSRWNAAELVIGSRVGLDIPEGGTFEPVQGAQAGELGRSCPDAINLQASAV